MKAYRISFSGPDGGTAATGSIHSPSDDQAAQSAALLLRNSARFDAVTVEADGGVVAAFSRVDLGA